MQKAPEHCGHSSFVVLMHALSFSYDKLLDAALALLRSEPKGEWRLCDLTPQIPEVQSMHPSLRRSLVSQLTQSLGNHPDVQRRRVGERFFYSIKGKGRLCACDTAYSDRVRKAERTLTSSGLTAGVPSPVPTGRQKEEDLHPRRCKWGPLLQLCAVWQRRPRRRPRQPQRQPRRRRKALQRVGLPSSK